MLGEIIITKTYAILFLQWMYENCYPTTVCMTKLNMVLISHVVNEYQIKGVHIRKTNISFSRYFKLQYGVVMTEVQLTALYASMP